MKKEKIWYLIPSSPFSFQSPKSALFSNDQELEIFFFEMTSDTTQSPRYKESRFSTEIGFQSMLILIWVLKHVSKTLLRVHSVLLKFIVLYHNVRQ